MIKKYSLLLIKNGLTTGLGAIFTFYVILGVSRGQAAEWIYITGLLALMDAVVNMAVYDNRIINSDPHGAIDRSAFSESAVWFIVFAIAFPILLISSKLADSDYIFAIPILIFSKIISPVIMIEMANNDLNGNTEKILRLQVLSQIFAIIPSLIIFLSASTYIALAVKELVYSLLLLFFMNKVSKNSFEINNIINSIRGQISIKLLSTIFRSNIPLRISILSDTMVSRTWPLIAVSFFGRDISYIAKEFIISQQINSLMSIFSERTLYSEYAQKKIFNKNIIIGVSISVAVAAFIMMLLYLGQATNIIPVRIREINLSHVGAYLALLMSLSFSKSILKVQFKFWWISCSYALGLVVLIIVLYFFDMSIFSVLALCYLSTLALVLVGIVIGLRGAT